MIDQYRGHNKKDVSNRQILYWYDNDSILTVSMRRYMHMVYYIFNPHTYTLHNMHIMKDDIYTNHKLISTMVLISISTLLVYIPYSINRSMKVRRLYILHNMMKKQYIEQSLHMNSSKMRMRDMKNILYDDHLNI